MRAELPASRQLGVALVSVLLIVAILMAVASRLLASHNLVINQHQTVFESDQALHYALGAETLAIQALYDDFHNSGKDLDHTGEIWARDIMPFELDEGGFMEAQVRDLNGCFNLNALAGSDAERAMEIGKRLLVSLGIPEQIAEQWKDWIDSDESATGWGAEDSEYLLAQPPHRTPNQRVLDLSELGLLRDMSPEYYERLIEVVCLLPQQELKVNVNTANASTLMALDKGLTESIVEPIVASERAYREVTDFLSAHSGFEAAQSLLTVSSNYFAVHVSANVGESSVTLRSLLHRDGTTGEVAVMQRDFGKLFKSRVQIDIEPTI